MHFTRTILLVIAPMLLVSRANAELRLLPPKTNTIAEVPRWQVKERRLNETEWYAVSYVTNPLTQEVRAMTNRYLEIGTGINVPDGAGGFRPANPSFQIVPGGVQATSTIHKVFLAADIHTAGSVHIRQREVLLKGHPLFLGYHDPADGTVRVLSELKTSVGLLIASNVVLYSNCFQSVVASMIYRNSPWGVSQELLLQSALPDPETLGLSPDSRLFIATEFLDETPEPVQTDRLIYRELDPIKRATLFEPDLIDSTLQFGPAGQFQMGPGRAFT